MNPIKYKLNSYDSIPFITKDKYQSLKKEKKLFLFYNLVIDWTNFNHPGYNNILEEWSGKEISNIYVSKAHSQNADMIVCYRTIAKIQKAPQETQGQQFYEKIYASEKYQKHASILEKINFSQPLMKQLQQLSADELNLLVQIPKIFQQPQKIRFKGIWYQQILFSQYFWLSMFTFLSFVISTGAYMIYNYSRSQILSHSGYFIFGAIKWTFIQYFFHRFLLHYTIKDFSGLRGHLIHHAFPNLNRKVAVSPFSLVKYLIIFLVFYKIFFQELQILMILNGLVSTLALYDLLHYYCHFGPEINIKWIKFMRIYHLKHHYRNQNAYFGVTNPFWDYFFGSAPENKLKQ